MLLTTQTKIEQDRIQRALSNIFPKANIVRFDISMNPAIAMHEGESSQKPCRHLPPLLKGDLACDFCRNGPTQHFTGEPGFSGLGTDSKIVNLKNGRMGEFFQVQKFSTQSLPQRGSRLIRIDLL